MRQRKWNTIQSKFLWKREREISKIIFSIFGDFRNIFKEISPFWDYQKNVTLCIKPYGRDSLLCNLIEWFGLQLSLPVPPLPPPWDEFPTMTVSLLKAPLTCTMLPDKAVEKLTLHNGFGPKLGQNKKKIKTFFWLNYRQENCCESSLLLWLHVFHSFGPLYPHHPLQKAKILKNEKNFFGCLLN